MKKLLLIAALFSTSAVYAQRWSLVSHSGSYSGFLALGADYKITRSISTTALLGYTPEFIAGEDLYSAALRTSIYSDEVAKGARYYAGFNVLVSLFDNDTYILLPSKYPYRYYPATGIRSALYSGIEIREKNYSIYFEVSSLDLYTETYVRSNFNMDIRDVVTYGFGIKVDTPHTVRMVRPIRK